jgi:hypothetical protein
MNLYRATKCNVRLFARTAITMEWSSDVSDTSLPLPSGTDAVDYTDVSIAQNYLRHSIRQFPFILVPADCETSDIQSGSFS